jgi:hypothetical protein
VLFPSYIIEVLFGCKPSEDFMTIIYDIPMQYHNTMYLWIFMCFGTILLIITVRSHRWMLGSPN